MAAIVCSVDAAYTLPLLVTLSSLRASFPSNRSLRLYLLHRGLPDEHLAAIDGVLPTVPVAVPSRLLAAVPDHPRFPREAAAPILLGELVPEGEMRAVFLDADLLVLDDPSELVDVDLGGRALAAAVDGAIVRCSARRGVPAWRERRIPASAPYFNAGVMVVALPRWRELEAGERARRYLAERRGGGFLHQEALNAVLWDEWRDLDPRWNLLASHVGRRPGATVERPGIVHFAGRMKPWRARLAGDHAAAYRARLAEVLETLTLPPTKGGLRDRLLGAYDRRLRDRFFPLEHALWRRGVI